MKIKNVFMGTMLCFIILLSISGCSLSGKSKSLDMRLKGTVYSELNHRVDQQNKEVYENDKYAVQITDSKQGRGFYCCMLAAWPKSGRDRKVADNNNAVIGDINDAKAIYFGPSLPLSTMYRSYYEDGKNIFEKKLMLAYKNGKKVKMKRFMVDDGRDIIGTNQRKPSKIKGLQMI